MAAPKTEDRQNTDPGISAVQNEHSANSSPTGEEWGEEQIERALGRLKEMHIQVWFSSLYFVWMLIQTLVTRNADDNP